MDTISGISYAANTTTGNALNTNYVSTTALATSEEMTREMTRLAERFACITGVSVVDAIEAFQRTAQFCTWRCSDSRLEDLELCVPEKEPELLISKDELDAALDELLAPVMGDTAEPVDRNRQNSN